MNVNELIAILEKCDGELDVVIENGDSYENAIVRVFESVSLYNEGDNKDDPLRHVIVIG